jgi:hypothetical protein
MRWNGAKSKRGYEVTLLDEDLMDDLRQFEGQHRKRISTWKKRQSEEETIQGTISDNASELF